MKIKLGELKDLDSFVMVDTVKDTGRVDTYYGHVIAQTTDTKTAVRYGKKIILKSGHAYVDDAGKQDRYGLWDKGLTVEKEKNDE